MFGYFVHQANTAKHTSSITLNTNLTAEKNSWVKTNVNIQLVVLRDNFVSTAQQSYILRNSGFEESWGRSWLCREQTPLYTARLCDVILNRWGSCLSHTFSNRYILLTIFFLEIVAGINYSLDPTFDCTWRIINHDVLGNVFYWVQGPKVWPLLIFDWVSVISAPQSSERMHRANMQQGWVLCSKSRISKIM